MGKGAGFAVTNNTQHDITISFSKLNCMFDGGDEGSNFAPISGTISAGRSLPGSGAQYIEAKGSGGCAFETSTFTATITGPSGSLSLDFSENSNSYAVNSTYLKSAGLVATTHVTPGDQYQLRVVVAGYTWNTQTWMNDLASSIGTRPLNRIAIPGTHDSGTYGIDIASPVAPTPDLPTWINAVYGLGPAIGLTTHAIISGWSKTQGLDVFIQLVSGIRYLDLRIVYNGNDFFLCHGLYSVSLDTVIGSIKGFLAIAPKEIIILDMNHLYGLDATSHGVLVQKIISAFGSKLAPSHFGSSVTPNTLWAGGYQIIALYADKSQTQHHPELWFSDTSDSDSVIRSPWPNKTDMVALHTAMDANIANRDTHRFFVLQGILTPDGTMIGNGLLPGYPGSNNTLAARVTPQVVHWLQAWSQRDINITIVDWFSPEYVDTVIGMNVR